MKFRRKPIVIEAIEWDGNGLTYNKIIKELDPKKKYVLPFMRDAKIHIRVLDEEFEARMGDWIIKGVKGQIYPLKRDLFEMTYEPVEGEE